MFAFRSNRQPEMSLEAELFLESERGRLYAEMRGVETTPDRETIDEPIHDLRQATLSLVENRDSQSLIRVVTSSVLVQTMLAYNTIQDVKPRHSAREQQRRGERPDDEAFVQTCRGLGSFLLHGIKVARWNPTQDRTDITGENSVAQTLNSIAEVQMGGRRKLKRFAKMLLRTA